MTRAVITGGAGFIGSRLAKRLLDEGASVDVVDRFSDYYEPRLKRRNVEPLAGRDGFRLIEGDLNELDLAGLLEGADFVYHLAGQPGVRASWGREFDIYLDDNVRATQRLLEAAKEASLEGFVYASSSSIYGDAERFPTPESSLPRPVSPYGVTKLAAEHLCHLYSSAFGVPACSVRYFTIFGPGQRPDMAFTRFIATALRDEPLRIFGDGLQARDFTFVDDAVQATIAAASRGTPGRAYNVAGGNHATVMDVVATLGRLVGSDLRVEHLDAVKGDARRTGADIELARQDLGYAPSVTLEQGLAAQLEAQRDEDR